MKHHFSLDRRRILMVILSGFALLLSEKLQAQDFIMRRTNSVGHWQTRIDNDGTFFNNDDSSRPIFPGGYWINPSGGVDTLVFGGGIWVGGRRRINGTLLPAVSYSYEPNGATDMFLPGSTIYDGTFGDTAAAARDKYRVYRSSDVVGPPWPIRSTSNGPAYIDDPALRVAAGPPFVIGDEDMFAIYKDSDPSMRSSTTSLAAGVEVRSQLAFWRKGHGADVIVVKNAILNTGQDTLFDPVVGLGLDGDINFPADDRLKGFQNEAVGGAVFYTANSPTDPFLGVIMLAGQHSADRLNAGLTTLKYWDLREDPHSDSDRYAFLTSGVFDTALSVIGDARLLMASASKQPLAPGDTMYFDYALYAVAASGQPALSSSDSDRVLHLAEEIDNDYYLGKLYRLAVPQAPTESSATIYPNPAHDWVRIRLPDRLRHEAVLYDLLGREVSRSVISGGEGYLNLTGLPVGSYLVRISGEAAARILECVR